MSSVIEKVVAADVAEQAAAVRLATVLAVQDQAQGLVTALTADDDAAPPAADDDAAARPAADGADPERPWALACLRIALAAGMDGVEDVILLRRSGATWAEIGAAAGITRQSAHERWNARVVAVLDRYGLGEPGGPVADDAP